MKKRLIFVVLLASTGVATASLQMFSHAPVALKHVEEIEISSLRPAYAWSKQNDDIDPTEPGSYGLQAYTNPYSLWVTDKQLDHYSTFAANGHLLKWEKGYALQMTDNSTYLCPDKKLVKDDCAKVYSFTKHGLSKSNLNEF